MKSIKKQIAKDAGWDPRLDSFDTNLKHVAKRQLQHKLRQKQKIELREMSEVCVCCGASLGDAELGSMLCPECNTYDK